MVFTNWALVIVTTILALITFFYMRHTKRMADIMVREFELRVTPFIVIDQLGWSGSVDSKIYKLKITNRGFLSVRIVKIILEWWYDKEPSKIYLLPQIFDKVLAKDESTNDNECKFPLTKGDLIKEQAEETMNYDFKQLLAMSKGNFYCIYEDINRKEQKTGILKHLDHL